MIDDEQNCENEMKEESTFREKVLMGVLLVVILALAAGGVNRASTSPKSYYEFIDPPVQSAISGEQSSEMAVGKGTAVITKVAAYEVKAVVKSKKNYHDEMGEIIPMDVALAWGRLNEKEIDAHVRYWQSGRWYYFRCDGTSPIAMESVEEASSNHHLMPADKTIQAKLKKIRTNDFVDLKGYLINVTYGNRTLTTSLSRSDHGAGACEIMLVTEVDVK